MKSELEKLAKKQLFYVGVKFSALEEPRTEYRFHPDRLWRFDFAYIKQKIAIEIEGGTWSNGRHNRGIGFEADCEKYNEAARLGWRVFRFTGSMVKSGAMLDFLINLFYEVAKNAAKQPNL